MVASSSAIGQLRSRRGSTRLCDGQRLCSVYTNAGRRRAATRGRADAHHGRDSGRVRVHDVEAPAAEQPRRAAGPNAGRARDRTPRQCVGTPSASRSGTRCCFHARRYATSYSKRVAVTGGGVLDQQAFGAAGTESLDDPEDRRRPVTTARECWPLGAPSAFDRVEHRDAGGRAWRRPATRDCARAPRSGRSHRGRGVELATALCSAPPQVSDAHERVGELDLARPRARAAPSRAPPRVAHVADPGLERGAEAQHPRAGERTPMRW